MSTSKKITAAVAAFAGLGAVAFGTTLTQPAIAQGPPPPPFMGRPHRGERHPELRRALRTLERTETDLHRSARDFGGHRLKAAELCHQAQIEIQQAIQYDKN